MFHGTRIPAVANADTTRRLSPVCARVSHYLVFSLAQLSESAAKEFQKKGALTKIKTSRFEYIRTTES